MLPIHNILKSQKLFHKQITLQYKDDTFLFHQFSLQQVYMTNSDTPPKTSSLYNVQPRIPQNLEFFTHYHTLQKITNL